VFHTRGGAAGQWACHMIRAAQSARALANEVMTALSRVWSQVVPRYEEPNGREQTRKRGELRTTTRATCAAFVISITGLSLLPLGRI